MYKNRIRGIRCRASWLRTAKSIPIKGAGCKSGGCARKAVELTSGDLPFRLGIETEGGTIHPDRAAEVSRGRISSARDEGPNGLGREVEVKEAASKRRNA